MSHHPSPEDLQEYLDGELKSSLREKMAAHIEDCTPCRDLLDSYHQSRAALRDTFSALAGATPLDNLSKNVIEALHEPTPSSNRIPFRALAVAAVFFLALFLTWSPPQKTPLPILPGGSGCEVEYFSTPDDKDILYFDLDADTKVLWVLDDTPVSQTS